MKSKKTRIKQRPAGPIGYEQYPYARLYYYMFYKPGDIAVTTGQHWVLEKKSHREAVAEVKNVRIYNQLQKEKWKFDDLIILGIWNVSTHANVSGHFVKGMEFDKFLNREVFKYHPDISQTEVPKNRTGFDSEQIILKDIYDGPKRIKEYLAKGGQPVEDEELPREFTPRDYLDEQDLNTFHNDFMKPKILNLSQTRVDCIRACGAGKSQTPYLAYYKTYVHLWSGKGNPINITLGPDNGIVRNNAMGMSGHDQAVGNNTLHIVWTECLQDFDTDKRNNLVAVKSQAEVRNTKGEIVEKALNRGEVFRKLLKDNKHRPIMVHCGYSGYYQHNSTTCLSYQMRRANKTFYWAFLDEVHRTLNADWASWSKIHDDSVVFVKHRFMPTATPNKLKSAIKDYNKLYGMGEFSDVSFPPLDNVEAFERGYIRKYNVFQLSFGDDLPSEVFEKLSEGKEPYLRVKGTGVVVPFKYWMELKTFYTFKQIYPAFKHTLGVCNRIANIDSYAEFIEAVKKPMLLNMFDGNYNHPDYKRLINLHVECMRTDIDDNGELRAKADEIAKNYDDSLLLHCQLLGEGWNPGGTLSEKDKKYKGFIDSIQFIDPVHSRMRIAQNAGRGVRSPHLKPNCWLIMSWLNVEMDDKYAEYKNNYNKRAETLHEVAVALGVPSKFVHDHIVLKTYKPKFKKSINPTRGSNDWDSDIEIDPFADEFLKVVEGIRDGCGAIHPMHETAEKIAKLWIDYLKLNNYEFINFDPVNKQSIKVPFYKFVREDEQLSKEIDDWYLIDSDDPNRSLKYTNILRPIVDGKFVGNSIQTHIALDKANEKCKESTAWSAMKQEFEREIPAEVLDALYAFKEFRGSNTFNAEEFLRKYNATAPVVISKYNIKLFDTYKQCCLIGPNGKPVLEVSYANAHSALRTKDKNSFWGKAVFVDMLKEMQSELDSRVNFIQETQKKYINMSITTDRLQKKATQEIKLKYPLLAKHALAKASIWVRNNDSDETIKIQKANLRKVEQYVEQKLDAHGDDFENCKEFCDWVSSTMLADIGVDPEENSPKKYGWQSKIVFWQFAENNPNRKPKFKNAYKAFLERTNKRTGRNNREYKYISVEGKLYNNFQEIADAGYIIDGEGGFKTTYKKGEVRPITESAIRRRCNLDQYHDWFFVMDSTVE